MDEELGVDEDVTHEDGAGGEDPAVKTHHQHCRHIQPAGMENKHFWAKIIVFIWAKSDICILYSVAPK